MFTINKKVSFEFVEKKSKFLAELFFVKNEIEVRAILKSQKEKYKTATHIVYAFVLGKNQEIIFSSDAGEPAGTSGKPALIVLQKNNFTNTLVTITRWFGGILLGKAGLVKAYSDAVKGAIDEARKNFSIEELKEKKSFTFSASYELYASLKNVFKKYHFISFEEKFLTEVSITGEVEQCDFFSFSEDVKKASCGRICIL